MLYVELTDIVQETFARGEVDYQRRMQIRHGAGMCSTEVLNALLVPILFLALFVLYFLMDVMFPKEGEH